MVRRLEIATAAMAMEGTRFHHQGRQPFRGIDCVGVVKCSKDLAGGDRLSDYTDYDRYPNPPELIAALDERMDRVEGLPRIADVGACWTRDDAVGSPQHVFMLVPGPIGRSGLWMIHAWATLRRVTYGPYAAPWIGWTYGFWRFRDLEAD